MSGRRGSGDRAGRHVTLPTPSKSQAAPYAPARSHHTTELTDLTLHHTSTVTRLTLVPSDVAMDWSTMLTHFDTWQRAAGRPATTRDLRRWQLRRFARAFPAPADVTTDQLLAWLIDQRWSPHTLRSHRATLRSFYGWMAAAGLIEHSPAELLPPVRTPLATAHPVPDVVWRTAMAAAEPRVQTMIVLGARVGMRRAEIARCAREDLVQDTLTDWSLLVHGKGARERLVPLHPDVARLVRQHDPGWLFPSAHGGHLTPDRVGRLLSEALGDGYSGHALRHRFATSAYAAQRDLLAVQALLGHAKVETTRGYVALPTDALRAAVAAA